MNWLYKFKESKFGQIFQYSLIKYIALGIGFLKGIVNAKFLGPELLGILGNLILVLGYCSYANLGVLNAMNREYVLYKDKDEKKADEVINTAFTFLFLVSIVLLIFGIGSLVIYKNQFGIYLLLIFIIAIFEQFRALFVNYFRLMDNYKLINLIEIIYSIIAFIITFILIEKMEVFAVLLSMLVCGIAIFIVGIYKMKKVKITLNKSILKDLISVGVPLLIYNLGFYILTTVDRFIIIKYLDKSALGYYTFANSMVSGTLVFITSLLFLLYPKVIKEFNERQGVNIPNKVKSYTKVLELAGVIFFIVGIICMRPFIGIFLPRYMESIGVYMLLLMAVIINNLAYFSNCYIVSNGKQKYLVYLQIATIILNFVLNTVFVKFGLGIKGVALGTLCANFMYSLLQYLIFIKLNTKKISFKNIWEIYSKISIFTIVQIILLFFNDNYYLIVGVTIIITMLLYVKEILNINKYIKIIKSGVEV